MKTTILSLVTLSYLLIGCGNSSNNSKNSSNSTSSSQTNIETIEDAKEAFNSLDMNPTSSSLSSGQIQKISIQPSSTHIKELSKLIGDDLFPTLSNISSLEHFQKTNKTTTKDCPYGGSISQEEFEDSTKIIITFNSCKLKRASVSDGIITIIGDEENNSAKAIIKVTNKDEDKTVSNNITFNLKYMENPAEFRFTLDGSVKTKSNSSKFSNLIYNNMKINLGKDDSSLWKTIDGGINIKNNCFTKSYTFATPQKIRYGSSYANNIRSGLLKVNNSSYTFESPYVTIKTASTEETILQSELKNKNTLIECK